MTGLGPAMYAHTPTLSEGMGIQPFIGHLSRLQQILSYRRHDAEDRRPILSLSP